MVGNAVVSRRVPSALYCEVYGFSITWYSASVPCTAQRTTQRNRLAMYFTPTCGTSRISSGQVHKHTVISSPTRSFSSAVSGVQCTASTRTRTAPYSAGASNTVNSATVYRPEKLSECTSSGCSARKYGRVSGFVTYSASGKSNSSSEMPSAYRSSVKPIRP